MGPLRGALRRRGPWRRIAGGRYIVSDIGVQFVKPEAVDSFCKAGQETDGQGVAALTRTSCSNRSRSAREFDVQARNPDHNVHIGGDYMVFSGVYGPPFVREGNVRAARHDV